MLRPLVQGNAESPLDFYVNCTPGLFDIGTELLFADCKFNPRMVLQMVGTNDSNRQKSSVEEHCSRLLEATKDKFPGVKVYDFFLCFTKEILYTVIILI